MPWIDHKKTFHGHTDDHHVRWYKKNHWQARRVRTVCNKHEIYVFFPPDQYHSSGIRDDSTQPPKKRGTQRYAGDNPHTWLTMLTAWENLGTGERFTLERFLDTFFKDWAQASAILGTMAHHDQSEVMKHFTIEKLHAGTRALIQRARADYMAAQAAREPDPLAEDG